MLQKMLYKQEELQRRLKAIDFVDEEARTTYIKEHAQYLDQELHEMLRELQYFKKWKTYDWSDTEKGLRKDNAREEFIDAFHFMLNIALALELTAEDIYRIYCYKNKINHERQSNNY